MAKLKPWYQVVTPREDLREDRPLDASEFAVHLDHIRAQRAHDDYLQPERFFERTYLTRSLMDLSSQAVRRLSGIQVETSAVFNMATQFGGGKTHALTALYHLAIGGQAAQHWKGVAAILSRAQVPTVPRADVAVFVGTEFDVVDGRGGDGEPRRKTPWGEIAWQLGGAQALAVVAKHDELGIAPAGDVIRRMLPPGPVLILMDELLNYVSRARRSGLSDQLFNFLQNLSEEARARDNLVLCVSIPASELEMNPQDQRDYEALKKLLDRVGRAISMANETEVTEIIRRRLFEWYGLPNEGKRTAAAYAAWAAEHAPELANLGGENPVEVFRNAYPFHPAVISVFERKWQALPRFQRTRGILRLLALWVARAYRDEHRRATRDPLITLGSAPLEDQIFRDAVFEQLGSEQLSIPVTTDIVGKADAHAVRLDREATDAIKKARLHQRVSTIIFFESNGGQSQSKADAALSEIKAALGGPEINLAELDTVLEGLLATCYYLHAERNRYRFGLRPNLNQMLVTRRGAIPEPALDERVRKTIVELFNQVSKDGPKSIDRRYFPVRSNDVPDRPQLTLVVLGPDHLAAEASTQALLEQLLRESGNSGRTFKSGLIFAAPDSATAMLDTARTLLAWEDINDDTDAVGQLEESQQRALTQSLGRARADLREAIWRAYRRIFFLTQDNRLKDLDLGHVTSSMAPSLTKLIVNTLVRDDEITTSIGPSRLVRVWPPAMTAWSTRAVRDAFFASPALPRLLEPEAIKRTIADGVSARLLGYARMATDGRLVLERFGESLSESEVEISEDVYLLRAEDAQKLVEPPQLASLMLHPERVEVGPHQHVTFKASGLDQYGQPYAVETVVWSALGGIIDANGHFVACEAPGVYTVTARSGALHVDTHIRVAATPPAAAQAKPDSGPQTIRWSGTIPPQKWMNFYTKVLSKFVASPGLTLRVSFESPADSEHAKAKVDEIKSALRDLGLDEEATLS